ncbi:hypothetical protein DB32_004367 [Sandaracinus amylolyticus]|uniref:Uncharacterized protein n=1 Tax=Sandaracinus amylolyticus TaxID=927083 RepID=A0A0F6W4F1_9BACT|nr:hypothetical protein DB32_004367 [Sandaracinus amylolyticus]
MAWACVGCSLSHTRDRSDEHTLDAHVPLLDAGADGGLPDAWVPPDASEPPGCDDLDPCTREAIVGGVCVSTAVRDGALCDDGDSCTLGDRCVAGRCRGGAPSTGGAGLVSVPVPAFRGRSVGIGGDDFLFFRPEGTGTAVVLAHGEGGRLDELDELQLPTPGISRAFSLGEKLVAYVAFHGGGLLEISGDELFARGTFDVGPVLSAHHFAMIEDRLFVCMSDPFGPSDLRVLDASAPDVLVDLGTVPIPDGCRALAASTDRRRAYLSTGTDTLVVTPDGLIERALGIASTSVHVSDGFVTLNTERRVQLLREADGVELARVDAPVVQIARHTRRGLEVMTHEAGMRVLSFYEIRAGAPVVISREVVGPVDPGTGLAVETTSVWASHEDALLDGMRLFRMRATPPFLEEIRDPRRFWPYWMRAAGTTLHLRDDHGAIAIDLSDPAAPRAVAGGEFLGTDGMTIEVPNDGEIGLYGARSWWPTRGRHRPGSLFTQSLSHANVIGRSFDAAERPTDHATHALPGGPTYVHATYRHVYAESLDASGAHLDVTRWRAEQLFAPEPLVAGLEQRVDAPPGDPIAQIARLHGDTATAFATTAAWGSADLHWVVLGGGERVVGPLHLDIEVEDLAVDGDRIVAMGWHADPASPGSALTIHDIVFVTVERRGDALVEVSRAGWATPATSRVSTYAPIQLLRFDGRVVYAQLPFGTPDEPRPSIVALLASDLSARVGYPMRDPLPLFSASETDMGLVFSGPAGVYVARPWCP